jgi:hypothetical protein
MVLMATVVDDTPLMKSKTDQHHEPASRANDSELESGNDDELFGDGDGDTNVESDNEEDLLPKNISKMRVEVRQTFQAACYLLMFCNSVLAGVVTTTTKRMILQPLMATRQLERRVETFTIAINRFI